MAGTALTDMLFRTRSMRWQGMTLIELVIVVAVMGILLVTAVPSYSSYMLRVYRTEAIRMLLQASMCQQRIHASQGIYDTGRCQPVSEQQRYQITYLPADTQGQAYVAMAIPVGQQLEDPCGSLSLDQNGLRSTNGTNSSVPKCWSGR